MRRFEYDWIQSLSWDMDMLSLIAGIYRANGKEEVLLSQSPAILDSLVELAKVQSTEASNAIEGIVTTSTRLRQLVADKTTPRNRDEQEIMGYRDALNIIHDSLHMDKPAVLRSDLRRDNLILLKKDVTCQKKTLEERLEFRIKKLCKLIDKYHKDGSVLIFAQTTTYVDALYNILEEKYPDDVTRYHSRIKPERRKKQLLFDFLQGKGKIMIVTSAFSMGIDVPDIELVVHFNAPISMTDYIQQIGRAGRDGRKAHCVLFYDQNGDDDAISASFIKKAKKQSPKAAKTIKARLSQVRDFINSNNCMVCDILEYQGQHEVKTCKRCTVCAQKRRNSK